MKINVILDISKEFYIKGKIQFDHLNEGSHQWLMNHQYHIQIEDGIVISRKPFDEVLDIYLIKHSNNPSIHFKGNLKVPEHTSQTKLNNYLEAHIQSGILPLIYPFERFDIDIKLTLPQEYDAIGFEKKDGILYHHAKDTIDIAFIIHRQGDLHIYHNDYLTIYAQKYHDYQEMIQMSEIAKEIYINYENRFGLLNQPFHIVLNPRFDNGAYTRRNIVCLVDRIEGLDEDTFMHLSHEISHLWWYNGDFNIENGWLNESFAQYSSLLLVREKYGLDVYKDFIEKWKEIAKDLSSLSMIKEHPNESFNIQYYKGPYLLYLLNKEIGNDAMNQLLKDTYQSHISTTQQFLELCPQFQKYYIMEKLNDK